MKKLEQITACFMALSIGAASFAASAAVPESVDYSDELTVLRGLLDRCELAGIPTDYEAVNYKTIERFEGYINDDIKNYPGSNKDEMIAYNISCMDELYTKTKADLEAYLNGEKTAFSVKRPDMMNLTASGTMLKSEAEPVLSIGYGHAGMAFNDIPNFYGFGTNNIQMEIGPTHVYSKKGWNKLIKNDPVCTYEVDDTVYYDGNSSVKITFSSEKEDDHYILLHQSVAVTPGKTYVLKGMVKGENVVNAFMNVNTWSRDCEFEKGTYDWTEYTHEYTVPSGVENVVVRLFVDGLADSIHFDGFTFCEKGTTDNILYNGSFDDFESGEYYCNPSSSSIANVKNILKNGEENNVGVTLLISPHYMIDSLSSEVYNSNPPGFLKYNINHPEALAVLEAYLNTLLPQLKGYPALTSICLSNEPLFETTDFYLFYNDKFKEYLKSVHGTIENLNAKYGTNYPGFSWVNMPVNNLSNRNALAYDWMMFNDKVLADWHKWLYDIVKEHLPDVPVHSKMMGYFRKSNEEETDTKWIARGTDLELLGESSDWAGNDTWDYIDEPNRYFESMFLYDYQMSVLDKPVYNSEDHIIYDGNTEFSYNQRVHLRNNLWMGAAHGRSMSTIWIWDRVQNESSSSYNSILFRPDAVAETGKTNLDLIRLNAEMSKIQQAQPKVAIFYSKSSRLYDSYYLKTLFDTYKTILNSGQKVGVVSDRSIEKLSEYDVVVMPDVAYGTDETFEALSNFEGKIIYSGELLAYNEYKNSRDNSVLVAKSYKLDTKTISDYFAEFGISEVTLVDEETGAAPTDMDWSYVINNKEILLNVSNLTYENVKNVAVYYNGKKCTSMINLITGEDDIDTLSLEGHVPQLIKVYTGDTENAEIDSIFLDESAKTINWTYSTDSYTHANIYRITPSGEASLIAKETGTSYTYLSAGTYLVRAVSETGAESAGRIITVAEKLPFTISIDEMSLDNGYVNGKVSVTNNEATFTTGVVVIRVVSSTGDVSNYFYDYLTMSPYMKNTIRISMDGRGSVEAVEAYVCTDLISRNLSSEVIRYVESN